MSTHLILNYCVVREIQQITTIITTLIISNRTTTTIAVVITTVINIAITIIIRVAITVAVARPILSIHIINMRELRSPPSSQYALQLAAMYRLCIY